MNNELMIRRTHLSLGDAEYQWLSSRSDHPIENGYLFSRILTSKDALTSLLNELIKYIGLADTAAEEIKALFPAAFFEKNVLLLMFSDERSGSNQLRTGEERIEEDTVFLTLIRTRGLTMDMAYLFLMLPIAQCSVKRSEVNVINEPALW